MKPESTDLEAELRRYEKAIMQLHHNNARARRSMLRAWEALAWAREDQELKAICRTKEDLIRHSHHSARWGQFANVCKDELERMEALNK